MRVIFTLMVLLCSLNSVAQVKKGLKDKTKEFLTFKSLKSKLILQVNHPPIQKIPLDRIAIVSAGGKSGKELAEMTVSRISEFKGIKVVDRQHQGKVIDEIEGSQSPLVDKKYALKFGKQLGASAIIIISVRDIVKEGPITTSSSEKSGTVYRTELIATLSGTVQGIDLTTNEVLGAKNLNLRLSAVAVGIGSPVHPSWEALRGNILDTAANEIKKTFVPWKEERQEVFYQDKEFNMRDAYYALESGDAKYARELMTAGIQQAESAKDNKEKARAFYNMGLLCFVDGDFEGALQLLRRANLIKSNPIIRELTKAVNDAIISRNELIDMGNESVFTEGNP